MKTRVLFFGVTADVVGRREIVMDLENGLTVDSVIELLQQATPSLDKHKLIVALNEEYVSPKTTVKSGDTLAVFTAVSGG